MRGPKEMGGGFEMLAGCDIMVHGSVGLSREFQKWLMSWCSVCSCCKVRCTQKGGGGSDDGIQTDFLRLFAFLRTILLAHYCIHIPLLVACVHFCRGVLGVDLSPLECWSASHHFSSLIPLDPAGASRVIPGLQWKRQLRVMNITYTNLWTYSISITFTT